MRKILALSAAALLAGGVAHAQLTTVFSEDFNSYADNAAVAAGQWDASLLPGINTDEAVNGTQSMAHSGTDAGNQRIASAIPGGVDTSVEPLTVSFAMYDGNGDGFVAPYSATLNGRAGLAVGTAAWNYMFIGAYHADSTSNYVARVMGGGGGWQVTTAPRSVGWQEFTFVMDDGTIEFFHNGGATPVLTDTYTTMDGWDWVGLGSPAGGPYVDAYYDDILIQTGEEPAATDSSIDVDPVTLNFGSQELGTTSSPLTTTITNDGDGDDLEITSLTITGADQAYFAIDSGSTGTITQNNDEIVGITFTPDDGERAYSATLEIAHDAPGITSPVEVALDGTGTAAAPEPTDVTVGPTGDYATLSAAVADIIANNEHNNGEPVTITIEDDIIDTSTVDLSAFTDDVTITGDSARRTQTLVTVDLPDDGDTYLIVPQDAGDQTVENLILVPQYDAAISERFRPIETVGDDPVTGNTLTFSNLTIAASDDNGDPVDVLDELPAENTRWGGGASFHGVLLNPNDSAADTVFIFSDVQIGHYAHSGTTGGLTLDGTSGTLTITDSVIANGARRGIQSLGVENLEVNLSGTLIQGNNSSGWEADASDTNLIANIGPGTQFVENTGFHGMSYRGTGGLFITGDASDPVVFDGTGNTFGSGRGVFVSIPDAVPITISHAIFLNNPNAGLALFGADYSAGFTISDSIFQNNSTTTTFSVNVGELEIAGGSAGDTFTIERVTFLTDSSNRPETLNIASGIPVDIIVNVTDSIFAGDGDGNIRVSNTSTTLNIDNSAVVTQGANSLSDPPIVLGGTVNETDTINDDPLFLSTTFGDADYLHVDSQCYEGAGSGGSDLAGGATYVGGEPCAVSIDEWMLLHN